MKKFLICCFIAVFICSCKKDDKTNSPNSIASSENTLSKYVIIISANTEWKIVKEIFPEPILYKI
jgi:hypothetical protein